MDIQNHVAVVGHHAGAVNGVAAKANDLAGDVAAGHGDDFDRQREIAEKIHFFAFIGDADEGFCHRRDDFFPGQRRAAALDQLQMRVGLVGAINVKLQAAHVVQVKHLDAVVFQAFGGGFGAGHGAGKVVTVLRQGINKEVGGRAGAHTDDGVFVQVGQDFFNGGTGNGLL